MKSFKQFQIEQMTRYSSHGVVARPFGPKDDPTATNVRMPKPTKNPGRIPLPGQNPISTDVQAKPSSLAQSYGKNVGPVTRVTPQGVKAEPLKIPPRRPKKKEPPLPEQNPISTDKPAEVSNEPQSRSFAKGLDRNYLSGVRRVDTNKTSGGETKVAAKEPIKPSMKIPSENPKRRVTVPTRKPTYVNTRRNTMPDVQIPPPIRSVARETAVRKSYLKEKR